MSDSVGRRALNAVHRRLVLGRRVRVLAHHAAELLPPQARTVLDCGCGDGSLGALVASSRPGLAVTGVEVHRRPTTAIDVSLFDGRTIPCDDDSRDVVLLIDVLHHAEDPDRLLAEAARVARLAVIVKDHFTDPWLGDTRLRAMDWVGNVGHGVALPYAYRSRGEWSRAFDESQLDVQARRERLGIYPLLFRWLLEDGLHFMARAVPRRS